MAVWAGAGSRWPCWGWVTSVGGVVGCFVWTEAWADGVCVPARVWMPRGATPQAYVFIYAPDCVFRVEFSLRYSSRPFG